MGGLTRRQLVKVACGMATALGGGFAADDGAVDDRERERLRSFFDQFYRAPRAVDLPTPNTPPALGLTDEGWYEYRADGDRWHEISLGTAENPVSTGHFESLRAETFAVEPVKLGLLADAHYPGNGRGIGESGIRTTRRKLGEFVDAMNEWEADHVFFLGDSTVEWGSRAQSRRKIAEFRALVEENLDMPTHTVWGNHEYGNADEWGSDWSYEPWGVSEDSETWYGVDVGVAKVIVLNNGYSDTGHVENRFLPEQIEWLERELQTTRKPIVVISHLPLSVGTGQDYDHAGGEERVCRLLSRYDNVVCCLFGHCHHDSSSPPEETNQPSYFDQMREQRAYGLRHVFVPWIHRLEWDASYTPYGMLFLYPGGRARLEAPYSDTGTREVFAITTGARTAQFEEDSYLRKPRGRLRWETHFDSIDGFRRETTGDGRVALHERGVRLATGTASGDTAALAKIREFADASTPMTGGWTNCIWRCYARADAVQEATVDLLWGDPGTNYVGFRVDRGAIRGVREDGTGEVTTRDITPMRDGEAVLFQLYYSVELDRVNFIVGERGARPKRGLVPGSPDAPGSGHALHARIENAAATRQAIDLGWASMDKHPDLMIQH